MKRLDNIEAELNVPEREIGRIRTGQFARVIVDALAEDAFEGEVTRVAPEVEPTSGTFRVVVTLGQRRPAPEARDVRPGGRAHGHPFECTDDAARSGRDAARQEQPVRGQRGCRRAPRGHDRLRVRRQHIEILTGADEGDQVVMTGQDGLRDGTRVSIVEGYATEPS